MLKNKLPFGTIIILRDDIAEVIIDEGIEMNLNMVNQYHEFLLENLTAPFSLLIHKIFSYTYDFQAQMNIAVLPEINAMAVVSYSNSTANSTNLLAQFPREKEWNLKLFDNKIEAMMWLEQEQEKVKNISSS